MSREVSEAERLMTLERNASDAAKSMSVLVTETSDIKDRLKALEASDRRREVAEAGEVERDKALLSRLDSLEKGLAAFKKSVATPLWAVAAMLGTSLFAVVWKVLTSGALAGFIK